MNSNTSMYACPKCGNPNTHVERRPDGFCYCPDCQHRWKIGASQPKPTLFHRITASPEVLAKKLVYKAEISETLGGLSCSYQSFVSTIIPDLYFEKEPEAIAATVAKLKEVCDAEKN